MRYASLLLGLLLTLVACQPPTEPDPKSIDVTLTLSANSVFAWIVDNVEGDETVTETGVDNPVWTLKVGSRYEIINTTGAAHPFELLDEDGAKLLSQDIAGSLENDPDIGYEEEADYSSVRFTFTQKLADAARSYYCSLHPSMEGDIVSAD